MHLVETYALVSGCKISKPFIHLEPIDLPINKYITFHGFSPKGSSKQYNRWPDVLKMLKDDPEFTYDIIENIIINNIDLIILFLSSSK